MVEHGQFLVGSLTDDGQVTLLPSLGGEQVSWKMYKVVSVALYAAGEVASKPAD